MYVLRHFRPPPVLDGDRLFMCFSQTKFVRLTLKLANERVHGMRRGWPDVTSSTPKARSSVCRTADLVSKLKYLADERTDAASGCRGRC